MVGRLVGFVQFEVSVLRLFPSVVVICLYSSSRLLIQVRKSFAVPDLDFLLVFCSIVLLTSTVLLAICSILLLDICSIVSLASGTIVLHAFGTTVLLAIILLYAPHFH